MTPRNQGVSEKASEPCAAVRSGAPAPCLTQHGPVPVLVHIHSPRGDEMLGRPQSNRVGAMAIFEASCCQKSAQLLMTNASVGCKNLEQRLGML